MLKKCKRLQYEIEDLGSIRFTHGYAREFESIRKKLMAVINPLLINIRIDLLVADNVLLNNRNISLIFNDGIKSKVLVKINNAFSDYDMLLNHPNAEKLTEKDLRTIELYKIFFHSDSLTAFRETSLGIGIQIVDNMFYREMDDFFSDIYKKLEENIFSDKKDYPQSAKDIATELKRESCTR